MAKKTSKIVEQAVKAAQLYAGCAGTVRVKDAQKLYDQMRVKIARVAKHYGMDESSASDQITTEALRRGAVCPTPGKDI